MPKQYKRVKVSSCHHFEDFYFSGATVEEVSGLLLDYSILIPQPSLLEFLPSTPAFQKLYPGTRLLTPLLRK